jgi:hypothetical protein
MYRVLNNNKPARYPECKVHSSWKTCDYNKYSEALKYAKHWLGLYRTAVPAHMKIGVKYDFSGFGDTIEIAKIKTGKN